MTDLPKKARDRQRPFLRLDPRPATTAPDGDGAARGCFVPAVFGDLDQASIDLLTQNVAALGLLHDVLKTARDVVKTAKPIIEAILLAAAAGILGATGPAAILAIVPVVALIVAILDTTESILDLIEKKIIGRFAKRMLPRACRAMPHRVAVKQGASDVRVDDGQLVEVAGLCTASYASPIDVPFGQWQRWYDWTLEVQPDPEFAKVLSPAPHPPTDATKKPEEGVIQKTGTIELRWDQGALVPPAVDDARNGEPKTARSGPMTRADWSWPMPGQFVWAVGRWVYDCTRATTADASGRMATMLAPLKAIATARLEGFQFPENEGPVPVTQFTFFTCKRGGYIDHDAINDRDYEFLVDLPELPETDDVPFPIGRTNKNGTDFLHDTITLRPRLLVFVNSGAFTEAGTVLLEPEITLVPPEKGRIPTLARVKVPTSKLPATAQAAGFTLSLGWHDPVGDLGQDMRRITVKLERIEGNLGHEKRDKPDEITAVVKEIEQQLKDDAKKDVRDSLEKSFGETLGGFAAGLVDKLIDVFVDEIVDRFVSALTGAVEDALSSDEEWLVHVGVNGRWRAHQFDFDGKPRALGETHVFLLPKSEPIRVAMCSVDFDPVGDVMLDQRAKRLLDLDGSAPLWPSIVDPAGNAAQNLAIKKRLVLRYVFKLLTTLGDENDPLGFIDAKHFGLGDGGHPGFFQQAFATRALADQRTYVSSLTAPLSDHSVHYSIDIAKPT
ncbi:MAG: hypothetical protein H6825_10830 [Planctomycetes bacterium]|nr:hypothetical protein [Planctomycetota bacterium]